MRFVTSTSHMTKSDPFAWNRAIQELYHKKEDYTMQDVAIYNESNRSFITVFTFSDEAYMAVYDACDDDNIVISHMADGNKPNSMKMRVYTTKERLNELLEGE